jgi:multidrug efflux pump subunit AcrA (membrane-fusion protein)
VRKVRQINQPVSVSASGTVEAENTAKVAFQVAGKVVRVAVQEGDGVRAGQLLASVDPSDYQHGADAAAEQVAMAQSNLEQAKVAYNQAADEYQRMKKLYDRTSLAPNDFKKFEAAYLAARERYQAAEDGAPPGDQGAAQAALGQAEAQDKIARKRLVDTTLPAPIGGIVARKMIDVGDTAAPGMPVFVVMNLNPAKVRVGVPEAEIGKVKAGQSATIQVPSLEGESFEGKVTLVGVAAEPASRTFTVEIKVSNPHITLRAGMIAEARIRTDQVVEALTLPGEAVVRDPQGATLVYVYLPEQKRVFSRRVDVGSVYGREVEIRKGVNEQDLVVVAGQNRVTDGLLVNVLEDQQ